MSEAAQTYLLGRAWVDGAVRDDVLVEVVAGRFSRVETRAGDRAGAAARIDGLVLPGLANTHSHVFHRALRGRTQRGRGSFWTWREQMYSLAVHLDPDQFHALARATYAEMVAAGVSCVGEFHYLHHRPDGGAYDDPNLLGHALVDAAAEFGLRITLLDTVYLSGGFGAPVEGVQRRFSDGDPDAWAARQAAMQAALVPRTDARSGTAIHSVRAVPRGHLAAVVAAGVGRPRHVHLSEQVAENEASMAAYGATPTQVLDAAGVWGPLTSAVHATHVNAADIVVLGDSRAFVSVCPTTERDLADGTGPASALRAAGARLTLGSDSHAVIDLFEEMRAVELDERLATRTRGHFAAATLLEAATTTGHGSLGWDDAGAIAVGHRADLVVLDTASPRTAGTGADQHTAVFAATSADVRRVMTDGVWRTTGDPDEAAALGRELDRVIAAVWEGVG
ncbi:formimidoylglutamate deiminase [Nocardioides jishulii]|uniref:Formimidoylglutamate deiminase n=2 Tax=Nocardioides jishulii TaxID=2575440 RepID=A0A4U2YUT1_9ACTN|nr:formimidoylglutamate deiminase [Nocardioides jishulii]TKI63851.1 formimidoylglutamate deiminase [Nocardioides jishulii]